MDSAFNVFIHACYIFLGLVVVVAVVCAWAPSKHSDDPPRPFIPGKDKFPPT